MIVSTGVSCGMGYYIGDQMKFDKSTVSPKFFVLLNHAFPTLKLFDDAIIA
jgi:hypothetical protein